VEILLPVTIPIDKVDAGFIAGVASFHPIFFANA